MHNCTGSDDGIWYQQSVTQVELIDQLGSQFWNLRVNLNDIVIPDFFLHLPKLFLVAHTLVKFHNGNAGQQNIVVTDTFKSGDRFSLAVEGVNEDIGITKDHY